MIVLMWENKKDNYFDELLKKKQSFGRNELHLRYTKVEETIAYFWN